MVHPSFWSLKFWVHPKCCSLTFTMHSSFWSLNFRVLPGFCSFTLRIHPVFSECTLDIQGASSIEHTVNIYSDTRGVHVHPVHPGWIRPCSAVSEWPKENVVRLISRNFWIWIYLFIYRILYILLFFFYLDRKFNEAYFLPTKLRLRMCLRNL